MATLVWVALGSAAGGMARYLVSGVVGRLLGDAFPWGTIAVNITGGLVLGFLAAVVGQTDAARMTEVWALTAVGMIGSYTTVSSFSLQTLVLVQNGEVFSAGRNIVVSLVGCIAAVALGFWVGTLAAG
jgi:CrcB protein